MLNGRGSSTEGSLASLKQSFGAKHVFYMPSGRAALWLILRALSLLEPNKRRVVIPAYTCPAVASAILKAGLKPVLADIGRDDFGFSRLELSKKVGDDTLAVIAVHLFGFYAEAGDSYADCRRNGIYLVEDCAQALGIPAPDSGKRGSGLQADASFFSFGRGKPLSVLHGGLVTTSSDDICHVAKGVFRDLRVPPLASSAKYALTLGSYLLFSNPRLYWIPESLPFLHLGETVFEPDFEISKGLRFPALILSELMALAEEEQQTRKRNSAWYSEQFNDEPHIRKPPVGAFPYLRYPLILQRPGLRDDILRDLKRHGAGAARFYPCPLNELPGLREILQDGTLYENSRRLSENLITLPVHSGVTQTLLETIKTIVLRTVNAHN
jgi:dTDP-4-amino-4,6-dideoxygalactose transaminase